MNITVIGSGRWGSFIAWYLSSIGHSVLLYGRAGSAAFDSLMRTRTNGTVVFGDGVEFTTDISHAVEYSDIIVISINSQGLRELACSLAAIHGISEKTFVLCMKGIEIGSGMRLTQVMEDCLPKSSGVAVWVGPGHVQEFLAGVPNCMVIDSQRSEITDMLIRSFSSKLIRFYYGSDIIGSEIGAAAKNVIGVAAGILDGLSLSSLKGALMSRGMREIARLIKGLGGNELSAYGLCHLGDYEATLFSEHSHNRKYGELLAKGLPFDRLAEGHYTANAIVQLGQVHNVDLPICNAVYDIIYSSADPRETLCSLFLRSLKDEFYI